MSKEYKQTRQEDISATQSQSSETHIKHSVGFNLHAETEMEKDDLEKVKDNQNDEVKRIKDSLKFGAGSQSPAGLKKRIKCKLFPPHF